MSISSLLTCSWSTAICADADIPSETTTSSWSISLIFDMILSMSLPNFATSTFSFVAPIMTKAPAIPSESPSAKARVSSCKASHILGGIVPTMPKSINPTLPSLRTSRLPAWTSAWKKSFAMTERVHAFNADTSVASGSDEYFRMPSRSTRGTPSRYSIVNTLVLDAESTTSGHVTVVIWLESRKFLNFFKLEASLVKSSSPIIASLRSSTMPARGTPVSDGLRYSTTLAAAKINPRSAESAASTPGLRTLTATCSPVDLRMALWTCATLAEARGTLSNCE
mmetsp:Transcript_2004/g.3909  ORF Transcript_2004/g.3909 Transcript_2004/m.3909 type:complete len:281 (-) Transcript_2004:707-1549(-)